MNGNCETCNEPLEQLPPQDIPELRRRLWMAHCLNAACSKYLHTFTTRIDRDDDYDQPAVLEAA